MAGQREDFRSGPCVPDAHESAFTRGQVFAIGAKGHAGETRLAGRVVAPGQRPDGLSLLRSQITTSPGTGRLPPGPRLQEASRRPSGLKATAWMEAVCPRKQKISVPFDASQTRTVRSSPTEASRRPSGLYATAAMRAECPVRVKTSNPVVVSTTCTQ